MEKKEIKALLTDEFGNELGTAIYERLAFADDEFYGEPVGENIFASSFAEYYELVDRDDVVNLFKTLLDGKKDPLNFVKANIEDGDSLQYIVVCESDADAWLYTTE